VEQITLTETDAASASFEGSIAISGTNAPGVLYVVEGDTITVTYNDADDGTGSPAVVVDTAVVDCLPPAISNIHATNIEPRCASIAFSANEPVRGTVHYGLSCGVLTETASGSGYSTSPSIALVGLDDDTTYFYTVDAEDEAGNGVTDDNGGACYSFTTPAVPDYFTELFTSNNDLDNLTITFSPNGTSEFYDACTEPITKLPFPASTGTAISLSDDDSEEITLSGGATVSLYGTNYSSFFVGSNGYITFTHGETTTTESLANHLGTPMISGLFDDLDPTDGGAVRWAQLADRVVVTYDAVPEYSSSGTPPPNTVQIEMRFDGTIVLSYLDIEVETA